MDPQLSNLACDDLLKPLRELHVKNPIKICGVSEEEVRAKTWKYVREVCDMAEGKISPHEYSSSSVTQTMCQEVLVKGKV